MSTPKGRPGPNMGRLILGVLLLVVGIAVQASYWDALPAWWHLTFLLAILPFALLGARLRGGTRTT